MNSFYIKHINRALLKLSGKDAIDFLQGLITNDIKKLEENNIMFSAMLTGNGRFLFDFFIFKMAENLYIDIVESDLAAFVSKLKMYKLRRDVEITEVSDVKVYQVFAQEKIQLQDDDLFIGKDPRNAVLGYRAYLNDGQALDGFAEQELNYYQLLRIQNKIVEGGDLTKEKSIILEYGYKEQNAVAFDKGCYLGQELITRTERLGEIRKQLILLDLDHELSDKKLDLLAENKTKVLVLVSANNRYYYLVSSKSEADEIKSLIDF